jgi:hypothetical protein
MLVIRPRLGWPATWRAGLHALQQLAAQAHHGLGRMQQFLARRRDLCAAAPGAAHAALDQRHASQIGQGIDGLPGRLVAHAHVTCCLGDGAALRNPAQDGNATVGHVIAQRLGTESDDSAPPDSLVAGHIQLFLFEIFCV